MKTRTLNLNATEHATAHEAVQHLSTSGDDHAISIGARFFTVTAAELDRIYGLGVSPTAWFHHRPTGRIMSVPGRC